MKADCALCDFLHRFTFLSCQWLWVGCAFLPKYPRYC